MDIKLEQTTESTIGGRLGKCEVCNFNMAKYTCPKCEVKTCQLECLRIHKKELNCDGIRDKTKYIPLKQITESDLMSDYVFLESATNFTSARRTDKIKRCPARNQLSTKEIKLKKAADSEARKIKLSFLLPNFDKHKANKTYYDWKSEVIYWCIEWRFINANNKIIIDERCCESKTMNELIAKYFVSCDALSSLSCYRSKGLENIGLLLKAEGVRKSQNRFYLLDLSKTLQDNLQGKIIVEFPVIFVVFDSDLQEYDIINNNEDLVAEETRKHKDYYFQTTMKKRVKTGANSEVSRNVHSESLAYNSQKPVNFLFSNETDNFDDDDDDYMSD